MCVSNIHLSRNAFIFDAGSNKDYIVIGSDSGKISIVEFDVALNDWKPVHCEVFGKSGCRRIVPGQYLAADPKGRALIIGKKKPLIED